MTVYKYAILFSLCLAVSGCSTIEKSKTLKRMAIAGAIGYGLGQFKSNNKDAYGLIYAGAAASSAAAFTAFEEMQKNQKIDDENNQLRMKLDAFQKKFEPKVIQQGNSLFNSPLPKEVSGLVDPGEWKRYKLDQWVQDPNQLNVWYRQVEMFEIIPPSSR
jgi:hypothetical protein